MNKINLKELAELAELNNVEFGFNRRKLKLKNYLNECGLKWIDVEVGVHNDMFALESTVCNLDYELKTKLSESGVSYDEFNLKTYLDIKLYEDIKNDIVQTKFAECIGYLYLVQDNATYEVDIVVKKLDGKVNVMCNFEDIRKVNDDEVPQETPERFTLVRGFNAKHYFVYDEIEDVYYWTSDMLNEELEEKETEEERKKLIREDTSWFVEKNIFPEDCDL